SPEGEQLVDLLVALARLPRGATPEQASLIRALAQDLGLGFDPLDCDLGAKWAGPKPDVLAAATSEIPLPPLRGRVGAGGQPPRVSPPTEAGCDPPTRPSPARGEGKNLAAAWRTSGDTVERLEMLARRFVAEVISGEGEIAGFSRAQPVLSWIARELHPAV